MDVATPGREEERRSLDDITIVLDEGDTTTLKNSQYTLIGKVITDRTLNRNAIKDMLHKAWGDLEGLQISDVGLNLFLFAFSKEEECKEIMDRAPWFVMNKLISLQRWNSQVSMYEMNFNQVQFWVQIQRLPLEFLTVTCAEKILSPLGEVIEIEDPMVAGKIIRPFIRARVELNIQYPLSTGCWIPRKNLPKFWVVIKYERLQDLCFKCGVIGHEQKICKKERVMSSLNKNAHRYGPRVGVGPAKSIKTIIAEQARRQKRGQGEADTNSDEKNNAEEADSTSEDECIHKENIANKERLEYEVVLGALEGDGNLPSGWKERPPEQYPSPPFMEIVHENPSPPQEQPFFSNLRFPLQHGGPKGVDRSFPSSLTRRWVPGSEALVLQGPTSHAHVEGTTNLFNILHSSGAAERKMAWRFDEKGEQIDIMKISDKGSDKGQTSGHSSKQSQTLTHGISTNTETRPSGSMVMGPVDTSKPDWWAQEQFDNAAGYDKLQTDIQALRDEIRALGGGSNQDLGQIRNSDEAQLGDDGLGVNQAQRHYQRLSQEPEQVFQERGEHEEEPITPRFPGAYAGGDHEEDYVDPLFPVNYSELRRKPFEHLGACLTEEEIQYCRTVCRAKEITGGGRRQPKFYTRKAKQKVDSMDYTVELPSDEEEAPHLPRHKLHEEEESCLAIAVTNSLQLKRSRDAFKEQHCENISERSLDEYRTEKSRKGGLLNWAGQRKGLNDVEMISLKAEEAGQAMPPNVP